MFLPLGKKEMKHSLKSDKMSSRALEGEVKGGYKCEWKKCRVGWDPMLPVVGWPVCVRVEVLYRLAFHLSLLSYDQSRLRGIG